MNEFGLVASIKHFEVNCSCLDLSNEQLFEFHAILMYAY